MTEKRTTSTRMTAFLLALALVLALALAQMPAVLADEPVYVLMNIPYDEFYAAELGADDPLTLLHPRPSITPARGPLPAALITSTPTAVILQA